MGRSDHGLWGDLTATSGGSDRGLRDNRSVRLDLSSILGAFVLGPALAGALGAVNLGTALAFGQIAFAAVVVVMVRRP